MTDRTQADRTQADGSTLYNPLTAEEARVILHKGTERAGVGQYTHTKEAGTYICRQCNTPLYQSDSKFESHCGWPSFDDEIAGAVRRNIDADGRRIEIVCAELWRSSGTCFRRRTDDCEKHSALCQFAVDEVYSRWKRIAADDYRQQRCLTRKSVQVAERAWNCWKEKNLQP